MSPLLSLALTATLFAGDPPRKEPALAAKPHTVYAWTSEGDLRYTWCLPDQRLSGDIAEDDRPSLTVILHGSGLDYRWGHWNNKPGIFRPEDIVVAVDGTSPGPNDTRLFLGKKADARAFHDFLTEIRETFPVDRIFLYGHSQGGFFVVYYAGEYPGDVAGVVAHASGAWNWSKTGNDVKDVAIAFMHGTADPVVPYRQSVGSRDHYEKLGFPLLHLRRLQRYNHWPNAVRATEVLAWCDGMTTADSEHALACAARILEKKQPDSYRWRTTVGWSGARDVLRRFEEEGPQPFEDVSDEVAEEATALIERIEQEGAKHVAALEKHVQKKSDLTLDGKPWIGHLTAVREDFRGVDSVEAYCDDIGLDRVLAKHAKAAGKVLEAWYGKKDDAARCRAVLKHLPAAFLYEGLPSNLAKKMQEWRKDARSLRFSRRDIAAFDQFDRWQAGWDKGHEEYEKIWRRWK